VRSDVQTGNVLDHRRPTEQLQSSNGVALIAIAMVRYVGLDLQFSRN
jgi:hypothetical protein